MSKKLAIRGHATRGGEVIDLLKMLGGKEYRVCKMLGNNPNFVYYINHEGYISWDKEASGKATYTLEGFLVKFPYKVGDEVIYQRKNYFIKNAYWENNEVVYKLSDEAYEEGSSIPDTLIFDVKAEKIQPYKEQETMGENSTVINHEHKQLKVHSLGYDKVQLMIDDKYELKQEGDAYYIVRRQSQYPKTYEECCDVLTPDCVEDKHCNKNQVNGMKNVLAELLEHIKTTPKEELEREFEEIESEGWASVGPTVKEFMDFCHKVKKPKYPTTYDECCKILFGDESYSEVTFIPAKVNHSTYKGDIVTELPFEILPYEKQIRDFYRLLICRDAYWKIAGEQIGLGKPWKPDLCNENELKYCIEYSYGTIGKTLQFVRNYVLSFPTEEIRDAFYENFKDLIEQCKELL